MTALKEGDRVALPMRRGVVTRVTPHGFWIQLDGKPEEHKTWISIEEPWLEERLEPKEPKTLAERFAYAINRTCAEKGSNTPDFILAEFLTDCLAAFDKTTRQRNEWYILSQQSEENLAAVFRKERERILQLEEELAAARNRIEDDTETINRLRKGSR